MKKILPFLFFAAGLICFVFLALNSHINAIIHSLWRVGFSGFLILFLLHLLIYFLLGFAWKRTIPTLSFSQLVKSRIIRDAAGSCLPFSQIGGILIGTYATVTFFPEKFKKYLAAEKWNIATASNLVDVTVEAIGQILFILTALFIFLTYHHGSNFYFKTVWISALLLSTGLIAFTWLQNHFQACGSFLLRKIKNKKWQRFLKVKIVTLGGQLSKIWQNPLNILQGLLLHYLAWLYSAFLTWLGLYLLGFPIQWIDSIALEGISCAIISTFFFVPTAIGVQETAYISLGLAFGIPAEISFTLSILRRGTEILIGFPALFIWEGKEIIKNARQG